MRHAFAFPIHIRQAVRGYAQRAVDGLSASTFEQEPAYTAGLLGRLIGVAYDGPDGSVVLRATNVNSVAPGAAESWSGADLAITADIKQGNRRVIKAILVQAKRGGLTDLAPSERRGLIDQIREMRRLTRSPKVILYREIDGRREPQVLSGTRLASGLSTQPLWLSDYFVRRILTTLDGDTRPRFVDAVQESSLKQLFVLAQVQSSA